MLSPLLLYVLLMCLKSLYGRQSRTEGVCMFRRVRMKDDFARVPTQSKGSKEKIGWVACHVYDVDEMLRAS